jgi:hypothetical protein
MTASLIFILPPTNPPALGMALKGLSLQHGRDDMNTEHEYQKFCAMLARYGFTQCETTRYGFDELRAIGFSIDDIFSIESDMQAGFNKAEAIHAIQMA